MSAVPETLATPSADPSPAAAGPPPAIAIEHLYKTFRIPHRHYSTLKERVLHPFAATTV